MIGVKTVYQKSSCNVEDDADDDIGQKTNGSLDGRKILDLLEASFRSAKCHRRIVITHKRLRIVSVPFKTAHVRRTIKQIDANAVFFHNEFGISADFPFFSLQLIQLMNAGIQAAAMHMRAMFSAWWMLAGLSVMTLCLVSAIFSVDQGNPTYAKTYETRPKQVLERTIPTQSISSRSLRGVKASCGLSVGSLKYSMIVRMAVTPAQR
jgi:hypothetical protein